MCPFYPFSSVILDYKFTIFLLIYTILVDFALLNIKYIYILYNKGYIEVTEK